MALASCQCNKAGLRMPCAQEGGGFVCGRCGLPMSWEKPACPECAEKDAEIARLRANCLDAVAREGRAVARSSAFARALVNMAEAAIDVVGIRDGRGVPQPDDGNYETIRQTYSEVMMVLKGGA